MVVIHYGTSGSMYASSNSSEGGADVRHISLPLLNAKGIQ
jgi:hypothetical protein